MEHLMTTGQTYIPVATPTDNLGVAAVHGVAFSPIGNPHGIAAQADQAAHHQEGQRLTPNPHFWMVPAIVDC